MEVSKYDAFLESVTWSQKRALIQALTRDLFPEVEVSEKQRAASLKEIGQRDATRHRAVSVEEFLATCEKPGPRRRKQKNKVVATRK